MGEIHELFVLALSLAWFAGPTPAKKAREEIQRKEFWGPQDPPPIEILYVGLFPVLRREKRPQTKRICGGQGSLGGVWEGGLCPNSLSLEQVAQVPQEGHSGLDTFRPYSQYSWDFPPERNGGHLRPVTLMPVIRIFRVFVSAFSAFSAFSPCRFRIADFENPTDRL